MPGSLHDSQSLAAGASQPRTICPSLLAWASWVVAQSGQTPAVHHRLLLQHLDRISHGAIDRLLILMPPGSAKSTYASVLFPAWWFTAHPASSIIADVAHRRSRPAFRPPRRANWWQSTRPHLGYSLQPATIGCVAGRHRARATYFAAGVRGPITGRRADLVIIDDPVKSHAEADSPILRERRLELVPRRSDDPPEAGRPDRAHHDALARGRSGRPPARTEPGRMARAFAFPPWPRSDDPLGRPAGCAALAGVGGCSGARRANAIPSANALWSALFQQTAAAHSRRPVPDVDCIAVLGRGSPLSSLAASCAPGTSPPRRRTGGNDPDWTVGVKLAARRRRAIHRARRRAPARRSGGVEEAIARCRTDGWQVGDRSACRKIPARPARSQVQPGSPGVLPAIASQARARVGSKIDSRCTRGRTGGGAATSPSCAATGTMHFLEELRDFPHGRKDDQVDALSRAFAMLARHAGRPGASVSLCR